MTYPVNNFYSSTYSGISANGGSPTTVFDSTLIPADGYAMILSVMVANKSSTTRGLNMTLQKSGSATAAYLLYDVAIPSQVSFEVIDGNKFVLKRGDSLKAWMDSAGGANSADMVVSYVIYTPAVVGSLT
jgi:hypothetical protein